MDKKKILVLKLVILSSIAFVDAQDYEVMEQKANELTRWMTANLELTAKQVAAVRELNYELVFSAANEDEVEQTKKIIEKLDIVLSDDQMDKFLREMEYTTEN